MVPEHAEYCRQMKAMMEMMKKAATPAIDGGHGPSKAASGSIPGKIASFAWTFAERPTSIRVQDPGHYEDGTKGAIVREVREA